MRERIKCPGCFKRFWIFGTPDFAICPECDSLFPLRMEFPPRNLRPLAEYQPGVDLQTIEIGDEPRDMVPQSMATSTPVLPIAIFGQTLTVVVPEESCPDAFDKIAFQLNRDLEGLLAPEDEIRMAVARNYPLS